MINNLSGHGVQDFTINQLPSQTKQPTVTISGIAMVEIVEEATTPSTIVTLGASPNTPVTYATAGGIGKPPP